MNQKRINKKSPPKQKSEQLITSRSKSRDKSSSGDDKKSSTSLKKIFYKHEVFNKENSPTNFKKLHQIRQQALEQQDIKWKQSEQLSLKDKILHFVQNQALKDFDRPQIQRSFPQFQQTQPQPQQYDIDNKNILIKQQYIQDKGDYYENTKTFEPFQIVENYNPSNNRDQEILLHKYESNIKFLTAQTNQLLSYNKHLLLEDEIQQTKKKMSEINIDLRKLRIKMRSHEYTKEINFTYPVEKHNDEIIVKMPDEVSENEMKRYLHLKQKIATTNDVHQKQQDKLANLTTYHLSLTRKHILPSSTKDIDQLNFLEQKNSVSDFKNKLNKAVSCKQISIRSNNFTQSFNLSNSRISSKRINALSPQVLTQKSLIEKRNIIMRQRKLSLIDSLSKLNCFFSQKSNRIIEQIKLLKKQIDLMDQNLKFTDQNKKKLVENIDLIRKKNIQAQNNHRLGIQKQKPSITNVTVERKLNYLKEKDKLNMENKGSNIGLRQNKSLSPANYLSSPTKKISANYSPRDKKLKNDRQNY